MSEKLNKLNNINLSRSKIVYNANCLLKYNHNSSTFNVWFQFTFFSRDKPKLLFFDLTECVPTDLTKAASVLSGLDYVCPTTQVTWKHYSKFILPVFLGRFPLLQSLCQRRRSDRSHAYSNPSPCHAKVLLTNMHGQFSFYFILAFSIYFHVYNIQPRYNHNIDR